MENYKWYAEITDQDIYKPEWNILLKYILFTEYDR